MENLSNFFDIMKLIIGWLGIKLGGDLKKNSN